MPWAERRRGCASSPKETLRRLRGRCRPGVPCRRALRGFLRKRACTRPLLHAGVNGSIHGLHLRFNTLRPCTRRNHNGQRGINRHVPAVFHWEFIYHFNFASRLPPEANGDTGKAAPPVCARTNTAAQSAWVPPGSGRASLNKSGPPTWESLPGRR